jgi:hypothetical protein
MTMLVADELRGTLRQEITFDRNVELAAFRPHLLKVGEPTGALRIAIQDEAGRQVAESAAVPISEIEGDPHFQGVIRFQVPCAIRRGQPVFAVLKPEGGYSFDPGAFIAWCLDWDRPRNPQSGGIAYGWEAWTNRQEERGFRRG